MPRIIDSRAAHTYGVLDPTIIERRDTKFFHGGLEDAADIIILPQGGYRDRGGSDRVSRCRRKLEKIGLTAGMITATSPANLIDGADTTTSESAAKGAAAATIIEINLGAAAAVVAFDVLVFRATTGADAALRVQYFDGAAWLDFGQAFAVRTSARSRRIARAPSAGSVTAARWRLQAPTADALGVVTVGDIVLWRETAAVSDGRVRKFKISGDLKYELVITDHNIDVFNGSTWCAALPLDVGSDAVPLMKEEGSYDSVILYYPTMHTRRLQRQGADSEWNIEKVAFSELPRVDYGGTYTNGVDEIQDIAIYGFNSGDGFALTLAGVATDSIIYSGDAGTTAANIKTALEALSIVDPGMTVSALSSSRFRVTFTGGANAAKDWNLMTATALNLDGYVSVLSVQSGKAAGEGIISDAAGWPGVGRLVQQRQVLGGLKSRRNTLLSSVTGKPFNFDTTLPGATAALSYDLQDAAHGIVEIMDQQKLLLFTEGGMWFDANATLDATQAPAFKRTSSPGINPKCRPISLDSSVYFVQAGGRAIRQGTYSAVEESWAPENASVLAAALVPTPVDWTLLRSVTSTDADTIIFARDDGKAVAFTVMGAQEVSGFAPWVTDGAYRSFASDDDNRLWQLVERYGDLYLELANLDGLLDGAVEVTSATPAKTFGGLPGLDGKAVWAVADDLFVHGPLTVTAGAVTIPDYANKLRVGTWQAPFSLDVPFDARDETKSPMAAQKRVYEAELSVLKTTSVAISANGGPLVGLPLHKADAFTGFEVAPLDDPYTGVLVAEGMPGWSRAAHVKVSQLKPGKLTVRSVKKSVRA